MTRQKLNRFVAAIALGAVGLTAAPASAQQQGRAPQVRVEKQEEQVAPAKGAKAQKKQAQQQQRAARKAAPAQQQQAQPNRTAEPRRQPQRPLAVTEQEAAERRAAEQRQQNADRQRATEQQQQPQQRRTTTVQPQPRVQPQPQNNPARVPVNDGRNNGDGRNGQNQWPSNNRPEKRVTQQRQRQLIDLQQRRLVTYNQRLTQQQKLAQQRAKILQQQRRIAQYQYQQQYYERLRQQQLALANYRSYDYNNDPYYYTAPSYRYSRGGQYYQTNQYGANILREALNNGYAEGFNAGQADRQDNWRRGSYRDSYAYQDANFGYTGFYVEQSEYQYYFRQGFQRGYEDGLNSRNQYGYYDNGRLSILETVLTGILGLTSLVD